MPAYLRSAGQVFKPPLPGNPTWPCLEFDRKVQEDPMSTRRSFMWLSGIVAPAAILTKRVPAAMTQESEQRGEVMGSRPVPTSIAALPSMTSQVQPITNDE